MNNYIEQNGNKYWYLEDDIQRPYTCDLEFINDQLCINGKLCHREDGPAIEQSNGRNEYYQYGKLNRIGGPAVEYSNGTKEYYQYGKLHRIGGPAVEHFNGSKEYWENGKLHREDGPAVEWSDGTIEYWLNGRRIFEYNKEFEQFEIYEILK